MQWVHYFRNVIQRYQVIVEGWPSNIPFTNLSQVSCPLAELKMLLHRWESGSTFWKSLSDEELERLRQEREEKIESGDLVDRRRRTRSDKGKKRKNTEGTTATRHKRAETIRDSDTDTDVERDEPTGESRARSTTASVPATALVA
jgi:hypothetical protein